jgi:hypothetical protein
MLFDFPPAPGLGSFGILGRGIPVPAWMDKKATSASMPIFLATSINTSLPLASSLREKKGFDSQKMPGFTAEGLSVPFSVRSVRALRYPAASFRHARFPRCTLPIQLK